MDNQSPPRLSLSPSTSKLTPSTGANASASPSRTLRPSASAGNLSTPSVPPCIPPVADSQPSSQTQPDEIENKPPVPTENALPTFLDTDFWLDFSWEGSNEWPSQNDKQSTNQGEAVQPPEGDLSAILDSIFSSADLLDEQAASCETPAANVDACPTSDELFGLQETPTAEEASWIPSPVPEAQESEKRAGKRRMVDDEKSPTHEPSPVLEWPEETPLLERGDEELFWLMKACGGDPLEGIAFSEEPQALIERAPFPGPHTPEPPTALDDTPAIVPPVPPVKQSRNHKSSNKRKLDAAGLSTAHPTASRKHMGGFDERLRLDPRIPQDRPEVIDPKNRTTIRRHKRDVFINSVGNQGSYTVPKGKCKRSSKKVCKAPTQLTETMPISLPTVPPIPQLPSSSTPPAPVNLSQPAVSLQQTLREGSFSTRDSAQNGTPPADGAEEEDDDDIYTNYPL
ncbi:unnamed protein product [Cyclocybe aegerita]|uniref:Uncharacterized protein n=1 Tax=Cyclocybe aegerita TaxID=1973307 RepID=A0A8S0VWH8_CYCAE|nr:unnamed protein product [Cyclocybe aegerita]